MRKRQLKKIMIVSSTVVIIAVLGTSAFGIDYIRKNYLSKNNEVATSNFNDNLITPDKSQGTNIQSANSTEVSSGNTKSDTPSTTENQVAVSSPSTTTSNSKQSSNSGSGTSNTVSGSTSSSSGNNGGSTSKSSNTTTTSSKTSTSTTPTTPTVPTTPPSTGNNPVYVVDMILASYNNYEYKLTAEQSNAIPQGENATYENALANHLVSNYGKSYDTSLNSLAKLCYSDESALKNNFNNYRYSSIHVRIFAGPFYYHPDIPLNKLIADHVSVMKNEIDGYKNIGLYSTITKDDEGVFSVSGCIVYGNP